MNTFGCALTICLFSPSEIRVFGRRDGTAWKERSHTRLAGIKMSRNPLQTRPFDGTRDTPGAETRPGESPPGDSAGKMTRGACPGKSSNGKEKRPRSRREKNSAPRFFRPSPEKEIPSPEKRIPGLGISRSGSEIPRQTVQKVNFSNKILHKNPVLCKKIAQKSAIWAGLRKSRVTETIQNGTICLFSQAFHDILIARPEAKPLCLVGEVSMHVSNFFQLV